MRDSTISYKLAFVVTMYRYGDHEKHSYVLGVWSDKDEATKYGITEECWRANKYQYEITTWKIDGCECDDFTEEELKYYGK